MNDLALARNGRPPLATEPVLAGSTALVVLGMHRSGTSALAGMLHHLGVALGDRLMKATLDNPRGYWEHPTSSGSTSADGRARLGVGRHPAVTPGFDARRGGVPRAWSWRRFWAATSPARRVGPEGSRGCAG